MPKIITLTLAVILLAAVPASAKQRQNTCHLKPLLTSYSANYHAVKKLHGTRAPGRNIRKHGVKPGLKSTCRQIRKSRDTLRRMRHPGSTMLAPSRPRTPPAGTATLREAGGALGAIAACESGGNPGAVSPGGRYRGKYQFDYGTWASVGGSGDPAAASEAEQDKRAAMLYARAGSAPWPVCGR